MARADGDGRFYISFLQMGHGDCTMVRCPNGRTVMIDCGSDRYDYNGHLNDMRATIHSAAYLANYNRLDALVLTHYDKDHHNKITQLLGSQARQTRQEWPLDIAIDKLYHSSELNSYFYANSAFALSSTIAAKDIKAITHNGGKPKIENLAGFEWDVPDLPAQPAQPDYRNGEYLDAHGFVRIIDGTKSQDLPVYISILASNVHEYDKQELIDDGYLTDNDEDPTSSINTASVVILIEVGIAKVLILGDATKHTEKFLIDTHGNKLKDLTLVRVGHHGSSTTSSSPKFVNHVAPLQAVVSAALKESGHHLPRASVLKRFWDIGRLEKDQLAHDSYYWRRWDGENLGGTIEEEGNLFHYVKKSTIADLKITGSAGTITITVPP